MCDGGSITAAALLRVAENRELGKPAKQCPECGSEMTQSTEKMLASAVHHSGPNNLVWVCPACGHRDD